MNEIEIHFFLNNCFKVSGGTPRLLSGFNSYHIKTIDLLCKSMNCFLYGSDLRHERVNCAEKSIE